MAHCTSSRTTINGASSPCFGRATGTSALATAGRVPEDRACDGTRAIAPATSTVATLAPKNGAQIPESIRQAAADHRSQQGACELSGRHPSQRVPKARHGRNGTDQGHAGGHVSAEKSHAKAQSEQWRGMADQTHQRGTQRDRGTGNQNDQATINAVGQASPPGRHQRGRERRHTQQSPGPQAHGPRLMYAHGRQEQRNHGRDDREGATDDELHRGHGPQRAMPARPWPERGPVPAFQNASLRGTACSILAAS